MERGPPAPFSLIILYQGLCLPSNRSLKCPELVMSPLAVRTAHAVLLTWKSLTSPCTSLISACLSDFSYSCTFLGKLSHLLHVVRSLLGVLTASPVFLLWLWQIALYSHSFPLPIPCPLPCGFAVRPLRVYSLDPLILGMALICPG